MKKLFLLCIASVYILSGCIATTMAAANTVSSNDALPEKLFDGVYSGEGMRIESSGNVTFSFKSELKAFTENGITFIRETTQDQGGLGRTRTYRIIQTEPHKYICTEIEYLRQCRLTLAGDTIIIKTPLFERFGADDLFLNAVNIYQLMSDGSILKRTTFNKYLFYFKQEEVIAYKKQ